MNSRRASGKTDPKRIVVVTIADLPEGTGQVVSEPSLQRCIRLDIGSKSGMSMV